jgi:LETM1 and EF-hand domain-containing protein 1
MTFLFQWLDLHLVKKIPSSLLLLSRALYLPEGTPTTNALQATLSTLPETIVSRLYTVFNPLLKKKYKSCLCS